MDELTRSVIDYIKHEYIEADDDRELTATTPLISGGIVDSFSMISLKRFIEKKNGITIPDVEASPEAFDTVKGIVALVNKLKK